MTTSRSWARCALFFGSAVLGLSGCTQQTVGCPEVAGEFVALYRPIAGECGVPPRLVFDLDQGTHQLAGTGDSTVRTTRVVHKPTCEVEFEYDLKQLATNNEHELVSRWKMYGELDIISEREVFGELDRTIYDASDDPVCQGRLLARFLEEDYYQQLLAEANRRAAEEQGGEQATAD